MFDKEVPAIEEALRVAQRLNARPKRLKLDRISTQSVSQPQRRSLSRQAEAHRLQWLCDLELEAGRLLHRIHRGVSARF